MAFAEGLEEPGPVTLGGYRFRHKDGSVALAGVGWHQPDRGAGLRRIRHQLQGHHEAQGGRRASEGGRGTLPYPGGTDTGRHLHRPGRRPGYVALHQPPYRADARIHPPEEWQTQKLWPECLHPDDRERILAADKRFEAGGEESFSEEYGLLAKDGSVVWVREEAVLVKDEVGEPLYWQGVFYDLTERKALEERLEHRAFHDYLTDLPNRQLFVDRLRQALDRTRRTTDRKVAVLFTDLDEFKIINDSLGHETGDLLLTLVAERLGRCLPPEDSLARFGGDEFVVLIEDVEGLEMAVRVAGRIIEELARPFLLEDESCSPPPA